MSTYQQSIQGETGTPSFAISIAAKSILVSLALAAVLGLFIERDYGILPGIMHWLGQVIVSGYHGYFMPFMKFVVSSENQFMGSGGHLYVLGGAVLFEAMVASYFCTKLYRLAQIETVTKADWTKAGEYYLTAEKLANITLSLAYFLAAFSVMSFVFRIQVVPAPRLHIDWLMTLAAFAGAVVYCALHRHITFPVFLLPREIVQFANGQLKQLPEFARESDSIVRLTHSVQYQYQHQVLGDEESAARFKPKSA